MSMEKVGVLWSGKTKRGGNYMSGNIEIAGQKAKIAIFKNKNWRKKDDPDYGIFSVIKDRNG
jgi:hypothetical protein